jgi:hypothetical protein
LADLRGPWSIKPYLRETVLLRTRKGYRWPGKGGKKAPQMNADERR